MIGMKFNHTWQTYTSKVIVNFVAIIVETLTIQCEKCVHITSCIGKASTSRMSTTAGQSNFLVSCNSFRFAP